MWRGSGVGLRWRSVRRRERATAGGFAGALGIRNLQVLSCRTVEGPKGPAADDDQGADTRRGLVSHPPRRQADPILGTAPKRSLRERESGRGG
jgi:hypothetical protein